MIYIEFVKLVLGDRTGTLLLIPALVEGGGVNISAVNFSKYNNSLKHKSSTNCKNFVNLKNTQIWIVKQTQLIKITKIN